MFLRWLFASIFLILLGVAALNYLVDPAGIYNDRANPAGFAETLYRSSDGMWWHEDAVGDRKVKAALSRHAGEVACVVIGSSHGMQVGSPRQTPSLTGPCPTILNLAVSGASLEDHLTLAWLAANHGAHRIVLRADLWVLAFGKDPRWSSYSRDYEAARHAILGTPGESDGLDTAVGKWTNLFSLAYPQRSLTVLSQGGSRFAMQTAPPLDQVNGGSGAILLPDGSLVYSADFVRASSTRPIPLGGEVYLTDGRINTPMGIEAYQNCWSG